MQPELLALLQHSAPSFNRRHPTDARFMCDCSVHIGVERRGRVSWMKAWGVGKGARTRTHSGILGSFSYGNVINYG